MGHLVNPISFRLCNNSFWQSSWVSNINYNYFISLDLCYFSFLSRSLKGKRKVFGSYYFMYSHFSFFRCRKKMFILCHFLNLRFFDDAIYWSIFDKFFDIQCLNFSSRYVGIPFTVKFLKFLKKLLKFFYTMYFKNIEYSLYNFHSLFIRKKLSYLIPFREMKNLKVVLLPLKSVTAEILSNYVARCLERRFSLNRIVYPITTMIRKKTYFNRLDIEEGEFDKECDFKSGFDYIKGVKICYGGRFKKKRRVSVTKFEIGTVSPNSISERVTYSSSIAYTRFGVGGVKVWLCKNK